MANVPVIPEEVMVDILSRLPIKSLVRFRCVSKPWFYLFTTDPHFAKLHHLHQPNNLTIIGKKKDNGKLYCTSCDKSIPVEEFLFPHIPYHLSYEVVASCNGLICFSTETLAFSGKKLKLKTLFHLHIWNPYTRDIVTILSDYSRDLFYNVQFGFGFNQYSNEYKVVRIEYEFVKQKHKYTNVVSVYTLAKKSSWRSLNRFFPYYICDSRSSRNVLVNGALHWLACSRRLDLILSFDIRDEVFVEIPKPNKVGNTTGYIAELGGLLSWLYDDFSKNRVHIWMMQEYGVIDSWTQQYIIEDFLPSDFVKMLYPEWHSRILARLDTGELLIHEYNQKLVLFDPQNNSVKRLKWCDFDSGEAFTYLRSLITPIVNNAVCIPKKNVKKGRCNSSRRGI